MNSRKAVETLRGRWWTSDGWIEGTCQFNDKVIELDGKLLEPSAPISSDWTLYIPAPVDLHVHGGGGFDVMGGTTALRAVLCAAGATGTGSLLATSVTAPADAIGEFITTVADAMQAQEQGEQSSSARLLGAHLEGPFLNPNKLGAQPPHAIDPDLDLLRQWLEPGVVKVITAAPELPEFEQLLALCAEHNVRVQIGHTLCDWHTAQQAIVEGCGVTHLYNAMSGVAARRGGAATAALASANYAEIITDGIHVEKAAFDAAARAIPGLYSVTDATAASGMPDGRYRLGSIDVVKQGNRVQLADGTLAGSCLTQLGSIDVLRGWGIAWHRIGELCSNLPAKWLQEPTVGDIRTGTNADWLEIREERVEACWRGGYRHDREALGRTLAQMNRGKE